MFAAVGAATVYFAYPSIFSIFQAYDDEGFNLVSLHEYGQGGAIYEDVFGQYGPLYYQLMGTLIRLLGATPTHDVGRMITLILWVGGSLLLGYGLFRLTGRLLIGLVVQVTTFLTLFTLVNEPMHPGGLLVLLLIGIVTASILLIPRNPEAGMFLLGSLLAATILVKVNVGAFALVSVAFASTVIVPVLRKRVLRLTAGAAFVLTPIALMAGHLDESWGRVYALVVAMAAGAVAVTTLRVKASAILHGRHLAWLVGGLTTTAAVVLVVALAQGTGPVRLVRGVLTDPLRQPDIFVVPLLLPTWALLWGAANLLVAIAAAWFFRRREEPGPLPGLIRMAGGLLMMYAVAGPLLLGVYPFAMALPLAWLAIERSPPERSLPAHVLIPSLAVLQTLHAYPVAGSQVAWSAFLLLAVAAIEVSAGQTAIETWLSRTRVGSRVRYWISAIPVLALASLVVLGAAPRLRFFTEGYSNNVPLDLPGARRLRLPQEQAEVLRAITADLRANCSTFISLPGLNSFYVFAEMEAPTGLNQSGWIFVFDEETQSRIVQQVSPIDRLCALRNRPLEDIWRQRRPLPGTPLVRYILESFQPLSMHGDYEVLVRREVGR